MASSSTHLFSLSRAHSPPLPTSGQFYNSNSYSTHFHPPSSILLLSLPTSPSHRVGPRPASLYLAAYSSHIWTQGKSQVASPITAIALFLPSPLLLQAIITGKSEPLECFICSPQPFPVRALSSCSAGMLLSFILTEYLHCAHLLRVVASN